MQFMRVVSALSILGVTVFYSTKLFGMIQLNQVMSADEQKKTGIENLTDGQKRELEAWINSKFVLKISNSTETISLQENRNNGKQLLLSNNTLYEVAPIDRSKTSAWLSPVIMTVEPSGDSVYPWKITNTVTNQSVKGRVVPMKNPQPIIPEKK